jgi:hypothetical protein
MYRFEDIFRMTLTGMPHLLFWIAAILLSALLLARFRQKAERLLLAGSIVMLVNAALGIFYVFVYPIFHNAGMETLEAISVMQIYSLGRNLIGMTGAICLVYAFWLKFRSQAKAAIAEK